MLAECTGALALRPVEGLAPAQDGPGGLGRQVEADQGVVRFENSARRPFVAKLLHQAGQLVLEDVREPLDEEQRAGCSP